MTAFGTTGKKPIIIMIKHLINRIAGLLSIKRRMFIAPKAGEETPVTISYAITVCNEADQLRHLLDYLRTYCIEGDEIVVQADRANVTDAVREVVSSYPDIRYIEHDLHLDFAQAKNHLNEQCRGEWIFQLDADECPQRWLMEHMRAILHADPVELIKIPRINLFLDSKGAVTEHHVAWPDYQGRLYRNEPQHISWRRPIHEKIYGHKSYIYLPKEDLYAIRHLKTKEQDLKKWQIWKEQYL